MCQTRHCYPHHTMWARVYETHFSEYHVWAEFLEGLTRVKACCNPGACLPEDALGLHQWCCRAGVRGGCLFCWSVFNESDHAERIWPLARRGPVITTSCFPFFHPVHYWTNNLWGEKRMYLPSSFSLVLFSLCKAALCKVSILWLENNKLATVRAGL